MAGDFGAALAVEWLKARRSRVLVLTFAVAGIAAGIGGLFMFILRDPARARRLGLLGQKAELSGLTADWPGLLSFLAQVVAVGGLLLYAFVLTWMFGREFSDGSARYLLALPVSRARLVWAKFAVAALWSLALTAWLAALVVCLGWLLRLPGFSGSVLASGLLRVFAAGALLVPAMLPIGYVACAGRGYLAPLGTALGALVAAQVAGALGWASVVPWSVPAVVAGLAPDTDPGPLGLLLVALTGVTGVALTLSWWRGPDAGL